jgi:hypothetical protein
MSSAPATASIPARRSREVVFVDGARTPFGKAGSKGIYAETRADDLIVNQVCARLDLIELSLRIPGGSPALPA